MQGVAAKDVLTQTVDPSTQQLVEDANDDWLLGLGAGRVDGENVHQVLPLVVFLLNYFVFRSLLDQGEEELEFLLVQSVLHGVHVVVSIV